jgi:glycosyltransferase involved in cell wall biosynthesis
VKHQLLLARAFVQLHQRWPALQGQLGLALVGDGPLREPCRSLLAQAGLEAHAWLPGERSDVPALMRRFDAFVLPSLAEGISNTLLEAMASGVPVLATAVGGNPELVTTGRTGFTLPSEDAEAMAAAMQALAAEPARARALGQAARADAERRFSLPAMVAAYHALYEQRLHLRRLPAPATGP